MDRVLNKNTVLKLSKKPHLPEITLKVIIGNPKFFVPRPQKPEDKLRSSSQSKKNKQTNQKSNTFDQPVMTNKYSLALLNAPKQVKKVEKPLEEKKQEFVDEVWAVVYQNETWNFNSTDKAYRFIINNFADTKGICIENSKTGVLYTKNKFIDLFWNKNEEQIKKFNQKPVITQTKERKKITKFDEIMNDSESDDEYVYNDDSDFNKLEDLKKQKKEQEVRKGSNQYGEYNMWRYSNINQNEEKPQIPNQIKKVENNYQFNTNKNEAVPKSINPRNEKEKKQVDRNKYNKYSQQLQNDNYLRENDIYRVLDGSDNDPEEIEYQENMSQNDIIESNKKNTNEVISQPQNDSQSEGIFKHLDQSNDLENNFIELEKLLDAYNIIDHDTFLLELRRYISINKVTDIGFNVPNPSKNIDFQIDIDNSDNEVEHQMTRIQMDQCINKLLSEYIKSNINLIKKLDTKNKYNKDINNNSKTSQNGKNDFIITKVLDEESIRRLLQKDGDVINDERTERRVMQQKQEYPKSQQVPNRDVTNKYYMNSNPNRQAMNPNVVQQEYKQNKYQANPYNKYGINEISKVNKGQPMSRINNTQQPVEKKPYNEKPKNNFGHKKDDRMPKEYNMQNYKYY